MVKTLTFQDALQKLELPQPERNLFSSPDWLQVVQRTYGVRLFVKYIEANGQVRSYIVYAVVKNFLDWKICVCSYCDYFDGYVQSTEDWQAFFVALRREFPQYRITVRNLEDEHLRHLPELQEIDRERLHRLDIRGSEESVWKRTHGSFRSAVKQARQTGVKVRLCPFSDLATFYRMHLHLRRAKYRLFPQPYSLFINIWRQFMEKDRGFLLGAFDADDRMIGANIYLLCGDTFYYKFNTSRLSYLKQRPNNLLFWEGICLARQRGVSSIDLGSSGYEQHGLILYKNHTGAAMQDICHLGYAPPGYQFSQKRILKIFTRMMTVPWMPPAWTAWGSRIIYPYLA